MRPGSQGGRHRRALGVAIPRPASQSALPATQARERPWVWQPGICPPGSLALAHRSVVARLSRHEGPAGLLLLGSDERERGYAALLETARANKYRLRPVSAAHST